jgi:hypothetical protein
LQSRRQALLLLELVLLLVLELLLLLVFVLLLVLVLLLVFVAVLLLLLLLFVVPLGPAPRGPASLSSRKLSQSRSLGVPGTSPPSLSIPPSPSLSILSLHCVTVAVAGCQ